MVIASRATGRPVGGTNPPRVSVLSAASSWGNFCGRVSKFSGPGFLIWKLEMLRAPNPGRRFEEMPVTLRERVPSLSVGMWAWGGGDHQD